jgi:hypothetical protein
MRRSFLIVLLSLGLLAGCEENPQAPFDPEGELLPYLSMMRYVTVSFQAYTRHYRMERQSALDPGHTTYFEGHRNYWFTNSDTTFVISWQDSGFTTKAMFGVRQYTPYPLENRYRQQSSSTVAGFFDPVKRTLRDVRCSFRFAETTSPTEFRFTNASLSINDMDRGAVTEDSVEFIASGSNLQAVVGLGYNAEEYWLDGDYTKKTRLDSIMWNSHEVTPTLRVVFHR